MHELNLAMEILEIVCKTARQHNLKRVTDIWVVSGEMTGVASEALEFGFEIASKNTLAAGARLNLRRLAAIIRCDACGCRYPWKAHGFKCPECFHSGGEMVQGKEFYIDYIEGDEREYQQNDSS
ncbi:MAG: hydrogenase maturation nickel metallochaperone HypA [Tepidanaerobacteraceae bacterium]|nr:hydrogenase maturation nickel metallochaperone HypA [Tepidanaerobacteraceae bacterium]